MLGLWDIGQNVWITFRLNPHQPKGVAFGVYEIGEGAASVNLSWPLGELNLFGGQLFVPRVDVGRGASERPEVGARLEGMGAARLRRVALIRRRRMPLRECHCNRRFRVACLVRLPLVLC